MRSFTGRQRSLYLAAKLYELAAEFTDEELWAMLKEHNRDAKGGAMRDAIRALIGLHRSNEGAVPGDSHVRGIDSVDAPSARAHSRRSSAVIELFSSDRSSFPTVSSIAELVGVQPKPKEARDRYLARVARAVDLMSAVERETFFDSLQAKLSQRPNSFISRWSRVIKES